MNYLLMAPQGQDSNPWMAFLPMILVLFILYFFMMRPQIKRQKELKNFRDALAKGDKIVTTGGIYGKVLEIKDNYIIMQVDDNVKIRVDKSAVIKDMTDVPVK